MNNNTDDFSLSSRGKLIMQPSDHFVPSSDADSASGPSVFNFSISPNAGDENAGFLPQGRMEYSDSNQIAESRNPNLSHRSVGGGYADFLPQRRMEYRNPNRNAESRNPNLSQRDVEAFTLNDLRFQDIVINLGVPDGSTSKHCSLFSNDYYFFKNNIILPENKRLREIMNVDHYCHLRKVERVAIHIGNRKKTPYDAMSRRAEEPTRSIQIAPEATLTENRTTGASMIANTGLPDRFPVPQRGSEVNRVQDETSNEKFRDNRQFDFHPENSNEQHRVETFFGYPDCALNYAGGAPIIAKEGFFANVSIADAEPDNVTCYRCGIGLDRIEPDDNLAVEHDKFVGVEGCDLKYCRAECIARIEESITPVEIENNVDVEDSKENTREFKKCRSFIHREKSFDHNHMARTKYTSTFPEAFVMAWAGFYHNNIKGYARCFFCKCAITNWKKEDNPFIRHKTKSPSCIYMHKMILKGLIRANIYGEQEIIVRRPISTPAKFSMPPPQSDAPRPILATTPAHVPVAQNLRIIECDDLRDSPRFPKFALSSTRLTSFNHFPVQKKKVIGGSFSFVSDNGFFYSPSKLQGYNDRLMCFRCGYALHSFQLGDVANIDHDCERSIKCNIKYSREKKLREIENAVIPPALEKFAPIGALYEDTHSHVDCKYLDYRILSIKTSKKQAHMLGGIDWKNFNINPFEMAVFGFYSTEVGKFVRCFFCKHLVDCGPIETVHGYNPMTEVNKNHNNCQYLERLKTNLIIPRELILPPPAD